MQVYQQGSTTYYIASDGTYFGTEADALAHEQSGAQNELEFTDDSFTGGFGFSQATPMSDEEVTAYQTNLARFNQTQDEEDADRIHNINMSGTRNVGGLELGPSYFAPGGAYDNLPQSSKDAYTEMHRTGHEGEMISGADFLRSPAGFFLNPLAPFTGAEASFGGGSRQMFSPSGDLPGYDDTPDVIQRPANPAMDQALEGALEAPPGDGLSQEELQDFGMDQTESSNQAEIQEARRNRQQGLALQANLLDRILSFDPEQYQAQQYEKSLANQLSMSRGARGGAGSQQAALMQMLDESPQVYAEAARNADAMEQARLGQAAGVAGTYGELASTAFTQEAGYDIDRSKIGVSLVDIIARDTGTRMDIDQQQRQNLGNLALGLGNLDFKWTELSYQDQWQQWDDMTKRYGIDVNARTQIEIAAKEQEMTPWDYLTDAASLVLPFVAKKK
jgi:hypothetical protein